MKNPLKLYTQNNCGYCDIMKARLQSWDLNFDVINISEDTSAKQFLKDNGHKTVPQLYIGDFNINDGIDTYEFTEELFYDRLDVFIQEHTEDELYKFIHEHDEPV